MGVLGSKFGIILYPEYDLDLFQNLATSLYDQSPLIKNHEDPLVTFSEKCQPERQNNIKYIANRAFENSRFPCIQNVIRMFPKI